MNTQGSGSRPSTAIPASVSQSSPEEASLGWEDNFPREVQGARPNIPGKDVHQGADHQSLSERTSAAHQVTSYIQPQKTKFKRALQVVKQPALHVCRKGQKWFGGSTIIVRLTDRMIWMLGGGKVPPTLANRLMVYLANEPSPEKHTVVNRIVDCIQHHRKTLDLSGCRATSVPAEMTELTWLKKIDLENNLLNALPTCMDKLTKLQEVNCRGNQFTSIPEDLLTCSHLQHLDFSGNRLREVPAGIGQLANLTSLVLKQNAFTEIPDQLLELSAYGGRCRIDFSGNGLPQAAAIQWKERGKVPEMNLVCAELASARQAKKMTLAEKVENWYEVAGKRQPDNISVLFKNQKACGALNKYLERALTINNATSPISNEATANTITAIIDEMINDPVVMERCTAIAIEAVATCDDRVLLALNDMYVETKVAKVGKTGSAQDMIKLMRSMIRMQILNGIAEQKYQRIIIETNRRIARARAGGYSITYHRPDFTEVRLALQILTRNSLQLPTPPGQTMKYMKVAQLSSQEVDNATTQVLSEMEDYPDVQLAENLAGWEAFRNNIYKDYAGYVEEINEKYLNLLVKVENDINTDKVSTLKSGEKITSAGYAAFCDRIKKQNNEEVDELYRALALELVQNTPRKTYTQQQYLDNDGPNLQNTTEV